MIFNIPELDLSLNPDLCVLNARIKIAFRLCKLVVFITVAITSPFRADQLSVDTNSRLLFSSQTSTSFYSDRDTTVIIANGYVCHYFSFCNVSAMS